MKEIYFNTQIGKVHVVLGNRDNLDTNNLNQKVIYWLHGWGMDLTTFDNVLFKLKNYDLFKDYTMVLIDLPGFGKSDNPIRPLQLDDYVVVLRDIIKEIQRNDEIYFIGHSFGGRVAIKYASVFYVKKVFLVSAKVLKSKGFKYKFKIFKYKLKKYFFFVFSKKKYLKLITTSGSSDYKKANNVMKKTMKKIVNFDLVHLLKNIKSKVVVMGSVNDKTVSFYETNIIYQNIKNSVLYPFYNSDHFCYLTETKKFCNILRKELK